jgi:hypothetical protein
MKTELIEYQFEEPGYPAIRYQRTVQRYQPVGYGVITQRVKDRPGKRVPVRIECTNQYWIR